MIKAKECKGSLSPWMVTCLGLAVALIESGCSGISGLRSVGTERPSFLGIWDRSGQGTPNPENDSYVLSMRAGQARADAMARRDNDRKNAAGRIDDPLDDGERIVAAPNKSQSKKRVAPKSLALPDDKAIRVSLGRPEPIRGLADAPAPAMSIASKDFASPWKADTGDAPPKRAAEQSGPAEQVDLEPAPTRAAAQSQPASQPDWKSILSRAEDRLEALRTYQVKVSRIERVNGQLQPEEEILLSIRRDPKAVRLEWSNGPNKGREVIYSRDLDPRMLFVHMPSTTIPLPVMRIPVDSPLVMRNSRHSITEAGLDTIVDNLRKSEPAGNKAQSKSGIVSYQGTKKPTGLDRSCHHFVRLTATGETWNVYLDERSLLPAMVFAQDSHGQLIERYVYREISENPDQLAAAGAFQPDQRWGESKGFLSRFARAAAGNDLPGSQGSTTR